MKAKIQVASNQARQIAEHQLDKACSGGRALVSDRCVFEALLLLAKDRSIELEFCHSCDDGIVPLDLMGAWAVIEGREDEL